MSDVPEGWVKVRLGSILPLKYGKGLTKSKRTHGSIVVYGSSGPIGFHEEALTSGPTLIVGRKGSVGTAYLSLQPCWPIDTVYYVEEAPGLNLNFFRYLVGHLNLAQFDRSTAVPGLTLSDFEKISIPLPPQAEQRRIVAEIEKQFTRLDAASASLKQARVKLERYRTLVLGAAFEGRLVPTEAEVARAENRKCESGSQLLARMLADRRAQWERQQLEKMRYRGEEPKNEKWKLRYREPVQVKGTLWDLPDGWTWATIDQITSLVTSGSRIWSSHYAEHGAVFIRAQDIKTDRLDLSSVAFVDLPTGAEGTRTRVSPLDLLITITGANVTKTAMADEPPPEAYVSQHVALVRLVQPTLSRFIYYWIVAPNGGRKLLESAAYGAGKPGLNLDNIRELLVPLPPVAEQTRIVAELESTFSVVGQSHVIFVNTSIRAARLRQAILKQAFESGLVAQDPNDEPANVLLERIRAKLGAPIRQAARRKRTATHEELTTARA